jgi:hypothetical protein
VPAAALGGEAGCGGQPHQLDRAVIAHPAYLGEVVVHAQDIRQPLGLTRVPSVDARVAEFFAQRNFAVPSRSDGLQLRADDGPFAAGTGPLVTAPAERHPELAGLSRIWAVAAEENKKRPTP